MRLRTDNWFAGDVSRDRRVDLWTPIMKQPDSRRMESVGVWAVWEDRGPGEESGAPWHSSQI